MWTYSRAAELALLLALWAGGAWLATVWYQGNLWWPCEEHIIANTRAIAHYEAQLAKWEKQMTPPQTILYEEFVYQLVPDQPTKPIPKPEYPVLWDLSTSWGPATILARIPVLVWAGWNLVLACYFIPTWIMTFGSWVKRPREQLAPSSATPLDPNEYKYGQYINNKR